MYLISLLFLALFLLLGTAMLTAVNSALRRLHLQDPDLKEQHFFYRRIHHYFFPLHEYEGLLIATLSAKNFTRFFFSVVSFIFVLQAYRYEELGIPSLVLFLVLFIMLGFIVGEFIARIVGVKFPETTLKLCSPIASLLMLIALPMTWIVIRLFRTQINSVSFEEPMTHTRRVIMDIIQKANLSPNLTSHEQQLIESVLHFMERIAREVMVPRVDVFSLSAETPIREAAKLIEDEGYSRIPVYRNNVDNIVGVLMYKDILTKYMEFEEKKDPAILDAPIETIQKNVLYTPETKKISNLLLEFRKKQVHLAIVVDEYGGTEGVVTIEDILEEIVGEISDEYDEQEEMFSPQPDGSWIVDARMNILDIEEHMSIDIPQEADYDTLGGYIFHCTGTIPLKGFIIKKKDFEIEILNSDERKVEKVHIRKIETPLEETEEEEEDLE